MPAGALAPQGNGMPLMGQPQPGYVMMSPAGVPSLPPIPVAPVAAGTASRGFVMSPVPADPVTDGKKPSKTQDTVKEDSPWSGNFGK